MSLEPVVHNVGDALLSPAPRAVVAANRLSSLEPLKGVEAAMEALARTEYVMAEKALERQTTDNVVDQLRLQVRNRRANRKA